MKKRKSKVLRSYLIDFICFMFLGMTVDVVTDKFFESASPLTWILTIVLSAWFAYSSNITEDKKWTQ